jgi:endonuclease/exonuclease/phosphatase family metal-dependent hydrolase
MPLQRLPLMIVFAASLVAVPASARAADPGESHLTVLSFNIRYDNTSDGVNAWPHRREAVAKIVGRADVAGLQEVLHRQLTYLKQALPKYDSVGVGRDDGKQAGEYSPILYRRERFEVLDSGTFWLSDKPQEIGSLGWDASLPRICSWAKLRDKQSRQEFTFFNTHFDHRGPQARLESGKLIARKIHEIAGEGPALLSGDFNATPDSEPIQALLAANDRTTSLLDSRTASASAPEGPGTTWNGFTKIVPDRRIDFIFKQGPIEVLSYREITQQIDDGRFPSDHLPVMVEVALSAQ